MSIVLLSYFTHFPHKMEKTRPTKLLAGFREQAPPEGAESFLLSEARRQSGVKCATADSYSWRAPSLMTTG